MNEDIKKFVIDVLDQRAKALAKELGLSWDAEIGTLDTYAEYQNLLAMGQNKNHETGWRSRACLTPQLIGLERKRVEVMDCFGNKRRFWVGQSTGWMPCHLEIARRGSREGQAVSGAPFKSIRVVTEKR